LAPSPIASMATTEATPMMMPSKVSKVRIRLARSDRNAILAASAMLGSVMPLPGLPANTLFAT
jgi:hypothetical protein